MADNNRNRSYFDTLRQGISQRAAELSSDAAPKSVDGSDENDIRRPFQFDQPDYDRTEAPKDEMRKYWRQFETTPIIRKPITSFASRVTEPGYFIETTQLEEEEVEESGGAAAWLQDTLETDNIGWGQSIRKDDSDSDAKIGFRRDEIIPLTRDADVGEVFGTSRIEAVSDRVDGIKQKLSDNDEAIASKAYPLWLFLFGTPEEPWDADDISQFMKAQEMENFHPGMKQGVRGDMSVETISGDVADIAEYLQFDLRWIMSAMPMPIFVLGAFESASVGQVSGIAQQQDVNRQIKEARRELEEEFTPIVREVAKQQGVDSERAKNVTLKFGKPGETDLDIDRNEQVIRYISGSQGGQTQTQKNDQRNQQQRQGQVNPANAPAEDTSTEDSPPENDVPENIITRGETPESINNPTPSQ